MTQQENFQRTLLEKCHYRADENCDPTFYQTLNLELRKTFKCSLQKEDMKQKCRNSGKR